MGFTFIIDNTIKNRSSSLPSLETLHRLRCKLCTLADVRGNQHPYMEATGTTKPIVYMLGEAPGETEDEEDEQFVGESGQLLRARIPKNWQDRVRWNNTVRCRPPKNRLPTERETECCRPFVSEDIAKHKPKAVFGFGATPLSWVGVSGSISDWRGRRTPVNIGGHACWYYAFHHPAYLLRLRKFRGKPSLIGSELERAFVFDLKRAFAEVESLPDAVIHDEKMVREGVEILTGETGDLERLKNLLAWAKRQKLVGVDYETQGLRPYQEDARILTIGSGTKDLSFAFALHHREAKWKPSELKLVEDLWVDFLMSDVLKVVHQLAFEQEWSAVVWGNKVLRGGEWGDTISQAAVIDERKGEQRQKGRGGPLSLDFLVRQYFGINLKALSHLDRGHLEREPLEAVLNYNAPDAKYHCLLFNAQQEVLERIDQVKQYKMMLRRVPTCVKTQIKGVPILRSESKRLADKYMGIIEPTLDEISALGVVKKFTKLSGHDFNPESNKHVTKLLRDHMKRREGLRDGGKYSVDEETLKSIDHPLCALLLKLRKARKKYSTYVYQDAIWPDGLLHAQFQTVFHEARRLSCVEPNLQNMPKREEESREIRRQIKAPKGQVVASFDYGQIQFRGIAMTSKDKSIIKSLWERYDVHQYWADRIAHAYPARIGGKQHLGDWKLGKQSHMKKFRSDIKNQWTFPLFFGATLERVCEALEIPEDYVRPEYNAFWKMFSGVREWQEEMVKFYHDYGYVEDLAGFRRHAPLTRNQIFNTPIQSLEGVIVMDGMNRLSEYADKWGDEYQPNIQIHDDLTFFLNADELDDYADKIITEMLKVPFKFVNVPITVELSIGPDMFTMEEIMTASSDQWKHNAR